MLEVRLPVSNSIFYPADPGELSFTIEQALDEAELMINDPYEVKALIVPGLAFKYTLDTLAVAYKQLQGRKVDEVFLFGDPILHKQDNISFSSARFWETPLGKVETSHRLEKIVHDDDKRKDLMIFDDQKHEGESQLEMQLIFLQYIFKESFRLIPFMINDASPRLSSQSLLDHIDQDDLLIAVSHLSSGLPEDYSEDVDNITREAILNYKTDTLLSDPVELSSPSSVTTMVEIAKEKDWKVKELTYTVVDKKRLVDLKLALAAYAFYE